LYGRWRHAFGGDRPFAIAVTPAYNTAAKSLDGELAADWNLGPLTLLGAVRGMNKAYGVDTMRVALAAGAVVRINSYIGVSGDIASLLATRAGEKAAWSLGMVFAIPNSPHTFSLHASNVDVNTIQGSSKKTAIVSNKPIYGFEFTVPLHLSRFRPWFHKSQASRGVTGDVDATVAATLAIGPMKFPADTVVITVGQGVRWNNTDPLGHTITFAAGSGEANSELIPPNGAYVHRFSQPGTYPYYCTPHPFMKGVVVVR
jgi:amicyanin